MSEIVEGHISTQSIVDILEHWQQARSRLNAVEIAENLRCAVDLVELLRTAGIKLQESFYRNIKENARMDGFWGIVELMGHVTLAGFITEEERFGGKLGRVDIPSPTEGEMVATQYFGAGSIYRVTPTTESIARAVAVRKQPQPVTLFGLALSAPQPQQYTDGIDGDYGHDEDEEEDF